MLSGLISAIFHRRHPGRALFAPFRDLVQKRIRVFVETQDKR